MIKVNTKLKVLRQINFVNGEIHLKNSYVWVQPRTEAYYEWAIKNGDYTVA